MELLGGEVGSDRHTTRKKNFIFRLDILAEIFNLPFFFHNFFGGGLSTKGAICCCFHPSKWFKKEDIFFGWSIECMLEFKCCPVSRQKQQINWIYLGLIVFQKSVSNSIKTLFNEMKEKEKFFFLSKILTYSFNFSIFFCSGPNEPDFYPI